MNKYRLIYIGQKEDYFLKRPILYVELTPIIENKLLNGYSFYESEKEVFIFLLEMKHKEYFLNNPEEIKYINLNSFEYSELKTCDSTSIKAYKHEDYVKTFNEVIKDYHPKKEKSRGQKLAEIRKKINQNKQK